MDGRIGVCVCGILKRVGKCGRARMDGWASEGGSGSNCARLSCTGIDLNLSRGAGFDALHVGEHPSFNDYIIRRDNG